MSSREQLSGSCASNSITSCFVLCIRYAPYTRNTNFNIASNSGRRCRYLNIRLGGGEAGDGYAEGGTAYVVQPYPVAEGYTGGGFALLPPDNYLLGRLGRAP